MSKSRYITSIVLALIVLVAVTVLLSIGLEQFGFEAVLVGYMLGAIAGELIFWDTLAVRLSGIIYRISGAIFLFWLSFLTSGSPLLIILSLFLFSPIVGAAGSVFLFATSVFMLLASISFPIHLFAYSRDLY